MRLSVCVGVLQIADTVLALHAKGVVVRVITDDGMAKGQGSDIQKFIDAVRATAIETNKRVMCCGMVMSNVVFACVVVMPDKQGIQVRDDNARTYMHNKVRLLHRLLLTLRVLLMYRPPSNRVLCALPVVLHH